MRDPSGGSTPRATGGGRSRCGARRSAARRRASTRESVSSATRIRTQSWPRRKPSSPRCSERCCGRNVLVAGSRRLLLTSFDNPYCAPAHPKASTTARFSSSCTVTFAARSVRTRTNLTPDPSPAAATSGMPCTAASAGHRLRVACRTAARKRRRRARSPEGGTRRFHHRRCRRRRSSGRCLAWPR